MNKRKQEQAARNARGSKGRKRIAKAALGGRVVVVTPEKGFLLSLMRAQIPIAEKKRMAAIAAANPPIDLSAPYVPGEPQIPATQLSPPEPPPEPEAPEHDEWRARSRRLRQRSRLIDRAIARACKEAS